MLERAEREGTPQRVTCRRRPLWYSLPLAPAPEAFLTYLCPRLPRIILNQAAVTHANTLHGIRPRPGVETAAVAASFFSTAALLGCELLGRPYGNGVLKLEPAEIENLWIPWAGDGDSSGMTNLLQRVDELWRSGHEEEAVVEVDERLVCGRLGVDRGALSELRACYEVERNHRKRR